MSLLPDNNDLNISQLHDIVRNKVLIFLAKNKPFLETDLITTAEELTSEGVALYLKRLKKKELKLKAPPIGYVFKICRNTFINQYRKQKKLPTTITDDFSAFKYNDANHENTNPELQDVIDSLQQNLLKLFNESLTDSCKQLFYWRYKCEWDFATIAQVLYITHENTPDNAQAVSGAAFYVNALYSFVQNRFYGRFFFRKDYFNQKNKKTPQFLAVSISKW